MLAALNLAYQLVERGERGVPIDRHEPEGQAASASTAAAADTAHHELDLAPLIARLDAALNDGHLL